VVRGIIGIAVQLRYILCFRSLEHQNLCKLINLSIDKKASASGKQNPPGPYPNRNIGPGTR